MTANLPAVDKPLRVDVGDPAHLLAEDVASRVEDLVDGDLLIAAPRHTGDVAVGLGTSVRLRWTSPRGLFELPGRVVAHDRGRVRRWRVRPTGPVLLDQRRRYVRAPVAGQLAIVPDVDHPVCVVDCELLDLGEGGVRARIAAGPPRGYGPGTPLRVHLLLEGARVVLPGTVLRVEPVLPPPDRRRDVVVVFGQPVPHAAAIRRSVMRQQALERRAGRP